MAYTKQCITIIHNALFLPVVTRTNAIVQPQAMVVNSYNTFVTRFTMFCSLKAATKTMSVQHPTCI